MTTAAPRASRISGLGVGLLVVLLLVLGWQAATRSVDFPVYHRIATQILAGDYELYPHELYTDAMVPPHGFRYLPIIAFLFVPFGLLPLPIAAGAFYVLKLAVLAWVGRRIAEAAGLAPGGWTYPILALLVVAGYAAEELRYGNAHLLVVGLMVLAWIRVRRGEVLVPGVALALAIATKITPLALLGYFVLRRQIAACLVTVGVLGLLLVAPIPIVGTAANSHLLQGFARYALQKTEESDNYSLSGAMERMVGTPMPAVRSIHGSRPASLVLGPGAFLATVALIGLLAILSLVVLWRGSADPMVHLLEFSLVLVLMLVASPHTQRRYFVQLYVPVLALLAMMKTGSDRERQWSRLGAGAVMATGTLLPLVFGGRRLALAYESTAAYFWGTAVLLVVLFTLIAGRKRQSRRS